MNVWSLFSPFQLLSIASHHAPVSIARILFWWPTKHHQCCPHATWETIRWNVENLQETASSKRKDAPSLSSCQVPSCQVRVRPGDHLPHVPWDIGYFKLVLVLCRWPTLLWTWAQWPRPVQRTAICSAPPHPLALAFFLPPLWQTSLSLGDEGNNIETWCRDGRFIPDSQHFFGYASRDFFWWHVSMWWRAYPVCLHTWVLIVSFLKCLSRRMWFSRQRICPVFLNKPFHGGIIKLDPTDHFA